MMGQRIITIAIVLSSLVLAACSNTYGPPDGGKPQNYGQQRYIENQRYQQMIDQQQSD
jgi:outer membrane murein-binding lipoprotein Lpp